MLPIILRCVVVMLSHPGISTPAIDGLVVFMRLARSTPHIRSGTDRFKHKGSQAIGQAGSGQDLALLRSVLRIPQ